MNKTSRAESSSERKDLLSQMLARKRPGPEAGSLSLQQQGWVEQQHVHSPEVDRCFYTLCFGEES